MLIYYEYGTNITEKREVSDGYSMSRPSRGNFLFTVQSASTSQTSVSFCATSDSTVLHSCTLELRTTWAETVALGGWHAKDTGFSLSLCISRESQPDLNSLWTQGSPLLLLEFDSLNMTLVTGLRQYLSAWSMVCNLNIPGCLALEPYHLFGEFSAASSFMWLVLKVTFSVMVVVLQIPTRPLFFPFL